MKKISKIVILLGLVGLLSSCTSPDSTVSPNEEDEEQTSETKPSEEEIDFIDPTEEEEEEEEEEDEPAETLPAIDYVKVFARKSEYKNVYAWIDNGTSSPTLLTPAWPGATMTSYDDTYYYYDFHGHTSFNLIFNVPNKNQTSNLSVSHAGYYWYEGGQLTSNQSGSGNTTPLGDYTIVKSAKTYKGLPAVKNFSSTSVLYPYRGKRTDFRDETIYFAITTRFYDGDTSNNRKCWDSKNPNEDPEWRGDFKGLIQKMDYIKALGFTAIWITPVVKNASGKDYHGYHAINFKEVDPRYESSDVAFKDVIREAHNRDMKIILDVVFNHTGNYGEENLFPMLRYDAKNNPTYSGLSRNTSSGILDSSYDTAGGNQFNTRMQAMSGSKDIDNIYHHEGKASYEGSIKEQTGYIADDCIDLNTENPTVANYIIESYSKFIQMGVDAFRIDTMKHISRLTFNKYIWPGLYAIAEKCGNKDFYMFGEVCSTTRSVWNNNKAHDSCAFYTWKETKDYTFGNRATNEAAALQHWNDYANINDQPASRNALLNDGYTYHTPNYSGSSKCSVIDFPMHWNFNSAKDAYNVAVNGDQYYNDASYNVVYVDSHDFGPDGNNIRYNKGESAWKENISLMFTFRGVPCIYYGSEVEFQKGVQIDPYNQPLSNSGRAYFGGKLEGYVSASDFGVYNASGTVANTLSSNLSNHIRLLNKIRQKVPALSKGQYVSNGDMAFVRRYTSGDIDSLAVVAISNSSTFNGLPKGTYVDLISGNRVNCSGTLNVSVSGQGNLAVYVLENSSTGSLSQVR